MLQTQWWWQMQQFIVNISTGFILVEYKYILETND
jgi:hypothetical protein